MIKGINQRVYYILAHCRSFWGVRRRCLLICCATSMSPALGCLASRAHVCILSSGFSVLSLIMQKNARATTGSGQYLGKAAMAPGGGSGSRSLPLLPLLPHPNPSGDDHAKDPYLSSRLGQFSPIISSIPLSQTFLVAHETISLMGKKLSSCSWLMFPAEGLAFCL